MATDVQVALLKIASINPSTGEVLRDMECASDADVRQAVARAHVAQKAWAAVSVGKRTEILRNFQQVLHERKTEVARLIAREAGKPYIEAMLTEVMVVLDATRFLIENARSFLREHPLPHGSLAMKTKAGHILR